MNRRAPFALLLLLLHSASAARGSETPGDTIRESHEPSRIRGITLAPIEDMRLGDVGYGSKRCAVALSEIADLGATWISLTPFGRMDSLRDTEILHDFEIPVSINEKMLAEAARQARANGLRIALIPHLYVMSGEWRGEIELDNEEQTELWFQNYEQFIVRWACLAQEIGAELFSIGVEFKSTTNFYAERWRQIIELVRSYYSGPLTYSANWDEVEDVEFWDDLDFIGINAFWPLTTRPSSSYKEMKKSAERIAAELESLFVYWQKPILFTEFGVKTARDATLAPWEWPEHMKHLVYDEDCQAAAYLAIFETMALKPWFEGLFIWKYFSDPYDETQESRFGFSPQGKRAESVLKSWYGRSWDDACAVTALDEY